MQKSFEEYDEETIRKCFDVIKGLVDFADVAHSMSKLQEIAGKK